MNNDFSKLIERHEADKVKWELEKVKRETEAQTMGAMISLICLQSNMAVMAAFFGGGELKDD